MENEITYDDLLPVRSLDNDDVASFHATWSNGNDPDGETEVWISIRGSVEAGGFVLSCNDGDCGGMQREAGDTIYTTREAARQAAIAYADEHDECLEASAEVSA